MIKKILPVQRLKDIRKQYVHKTIVLCHGVFDVIHPGHLSYLNEAKGQGDILVVTITGDAYVHEKRKVVFNEKLRAELVASLPCVDYVAIVHEASALRALRLLKPQIFAKGAEFKKTLEKENGHNIHKEKAYVERYGGRLFFTKPVGISSVKIGHLLFAGSEPTIESSLYPNAVTKFKDIRHLVDYRFQDILEFIQRTKKLRVAVIGETIVDRWVAVTMHGLSHKNHSLTGNEVSNTSQMGGAGIIALHIASFAKKVDLYTNSVADIKAPMPQNLKIIEVVPGKVEKTRFINHEHAGVLYEHKVITIGALRRDISHALRNYDLIVVGDFGHGFIDEAYATHISNTTTPFLACVVQTNSSNYGFNIPTKYPKANYFSLSKLEAELCLQKKEADKTKLFAHVAQKLIAPYFSITFGEGGSMIYDGKKIYELQALSNDVRDTIGCGDAYFALSSIALSEGYHPRFALLVGSIGAALMTQVLGNERPVLREDFLTAAEIIL